MGALVSKLWYAETQRVHLTFEPPDRIASTVTVRLLEGLVPKNVCTLMPFQVNGPPPRIGAKSAPVSAGVAGDDNVSVGAAAGQRDGREVPNIAEGSGQRLMVQAADGGAHRDRRTGTRK